MIKTNEKNSNIEGWMQPFAAKAAEALIIALACFAPWAFGSVDAWAILLLDIGVELVAVLTAVYLWSTSQHVRLLSMPSLSLICLIFLTCFQIFPLTPAVFKSLAPFASQQWKSLTPTQLEKVMGDELTPVSSQNPTLSLVPDVTVHTMSRMVASFVLFQCVLALGGGFKSLKRFGLATSINATLVALFAIIQTLSWNEKIFWVRPSPVANQWYSGGPFISHNHLANYLNLGMGFSLGILFLGWYKNRKLGHGFSLWPAYCVGVLFVSILVSHSRGGFLAMSAATCGLLIMLRLRFGKLPLRLLFGLIAVVGFVITILIAIGDVNPYSDRLKTIFDSGDVSLATRISIWRASLLSWYDHPIWGNGLGSFPAAIGPYLTKDYGVFFHRADNEYIDMLVEGGSLGLALGLTALISIIIHARRAWHLASSPQEWSTVLGACFGGMAVAFHSTLDYGIHVPGVGFSVVVISGHLYKLGQRSRNGNNSRYTLVLRRLINTFVSLVMILSMIWVLRIQYRDYKCEMALKDSVIPAPGTKAPSADEGVYEYSDLERGRLALKQALLYRPNWGDGYLWLGKIHVNLYQLAEERRIGGLSRLTGETSREANPLWILRDVHTRSSASIEERASRVDDPVHVQLIPALRSFLEARRCNPFSALAQSKIAGLSFLLENGDPPVQYVKRAMRLSTWDEEVVDFIAEVAARIGESHIAARCWRKSLTLRPEVWPFVAVCAADVLTPDQILEELLVDGKNTYNFAGKLYSSQSDRPIRIRFLHAALDRLAHDQNLHESERLWLESQCRADLDQQDEAKRLMYQSIAMDPINLDHRARFSTLLLAWGDFEEAHRQALIGVGLSPEHEDLKEVLRKSVDAMSRGDRRRPARSPMR